MSLWTAQQHQWLQALGHPVLLLVGDPALSVIAPVPTPVAEPAVAPGTTAAARPAQADTRPSRPVSTATKRVNPIAAGEPVAVAGAVGEPGRTRDRTDVAAKRAALDEARRARRAARPAAPTAPQDDDALLAAILLATGLKGSAAQQAVAALAIDLEKLRADPSAKRALWRQLQDLRGGRKR
ncbi:hypothetical protein [Lysobacter sp. A421]